MSRRERRQRRDRVRVDDAARLVRLAQEMARRSDRLSSRGDPADDWVSEVVGNVLGVWDGDRIVVRVDGDLVQALLATPRNTELVAEWLTRFPYRAVACTLAEPLVLQDGDRTCTYHGFIAAGVRSVTSDAPPRSFRRGLPSANALWTTYGPIPEADGARFIWHFTEPDKPSGAQTITAFFRSEHSSEEARVESTIERLIEGLKRSYRAGGESGEDVDVLAPLSVLLMLYLCASEPDLDEIPPERLMRPQQLERVRVMNLGWRVGSAIRRWRESTSGETADGGARPGGSSLPPHIRAAHWQRVRIATRDADGAIVGDVHGEHGVDWHYELRWIPPTPVNVDAAGPQPAVRDIDREVRPPH